MSNFKKLNVFKGENSIFDYLNPKNHITPLVELPEVLNPFYKDGVRIYAKLLNYLPLANVKSIPAFNMLKKLKDSNRLEKISTIVENSSGNTVFSLAVIGRIFGIRKTKAIISYEVPLEKLLMLQLFGVESIVNKEPICPDPSDKNSGIYKAKKWGKRKGWVNPGQYDNWDNPKAHKEITGPQIFKQLKGDIQVFCAGLGTTGTIIGISSYLRSKNKNVKIVGVVRTPNNPIPGVRTRNLLRMIAFDWENYVDFIEEVGSKDSYLQSLNMIRQGIVVGPSSGFALAGLLKFLSKMKNNNELDLLRNKKGIINAVFVCCDFPFLYLRHYFMFLDVKNFPKLRNRNLLVEEKSIEAIEKIKEKNNLDDLRSKDSFEMKPIEVVSKFYKYSKEEIESKVSKGESGLLKKNHIIIDIRSKRDFAHFHLPDSISLSSLNFGLSNLEKIVKEFNLKNKKVLLVCNLGLKSSVIASLLRKRKIKAFSLEGGIIEWSNLNLPRWKPNLCLKKF